MKALKTLILAIFASLAGFSQAREFEKEIPSFSKLLISPKIKVILKKGDRESVRVLYSRIDPKRIHAEVSGKTLHLFLDDARMVDKREKVRVDNHTERVSIYRNAEITAYVTFKELDKLTVRGEEEVSVYDPVSSEKFRLKAYGESEIELASLTTEKIKATLYGENKLKIKSGDVRRQKFKLFGENMIDTRGIESETIATTIYGEGQVRAKATHWFHINAMGEPRVQLYGNAIVRKGIVLGTPSISRSELNP